MVPAAGEAPERQGPIAIFFGISDSLIQDQLNSPFSVPQLESCPEGLIARIRALAPLRRRDDGFGEGRDGRSSLSVGICRRRKVSGALGFLLVVGGEQEEVRKAVAGGDTHTSKIEVDVADGRQPELDVSA